ncbi:MAG: patatin-like phospholipase family protein [Gammaproteobacteria bacterium]|nr:patatin-like phospholipase family protein [Gammaproteobacteria bacterium]
MSYQPKDLFGHLHNNGQPKRILTLDGGGLRGILSVGILQKIEDILKQRHGGGTDFRLSHYFDLIAGTSTGAIIAAALAQGWSVEQVREKYMELGEKVFEKSFFRKGVLRAKYDDDKLIEELKEVYGENTTLRSDQLQTGLMIMTKRLDTGSPWPIGNNPMNKYFTSRPGGTIGNGDYPLWQVVRASTAAPSYFDPQKITIAEMDGYKKVKGEFVDGGVSPHNNPAMQALMYATLDGYNIGWPTGADKLLLISVGTGSANPNVDTSDIAAKNALKALASLMDDCAATQETLLQWLSSSPTARVIDRELGDMRNDLLGGRPLLSYLRYNTELGAEIVQQLISEHVDPKQIASLSEMDAPENMELLHKIGTAMAERDVQESDFPTRFNLV